MPDRKLHRTALVVIGLPIIAKLFLVVFFGGFGLGIRWLEVISLATYFGYLGWLGLMRRDFHRDNVRYMFYATALVALDILIYYSVRGWK